MSKKPTCEEFKRKIEELEKETISLMKTEDALKESERKFRLLAEQSPNMIFINYKGKVVYANKCAEEVLGYTREEFYAADFDFLSLIAPEYRELVKANFNKHLKGEEVEPYEYALLTKDGRRIEAITTTRLLNYDGEKAILGTVTDITKHKFVEEALHREQERFRILVEASPLAISMIGQDGHYEYVNPKFVEMFGYRLEDIPTGREWFAQAYPDGEYRQQVMTAWIKDLKDLKSCEGRSRTFTVTCKDGLKKIILFRPMTLATGQQFVTYEDITSQKRAEDALRESEKKYRDLVENMNDVIYQTDEKAVVTYVSPNIELIGGYHQSEVIGRKFTDFVYKQDLPDRMKRFQDIVSGGNVPTEYRYVKKSGQIIWIRTTARPIFKENRVIGVQGILTDITDRKLAEEALRKADARLRRHRDRLEETVKKRTLELEEKNKELKSQSQKLEEMNSALRILLEQRETDKEDFARTLIQNLRTLVLPYLEQLRGKQPSPEHDASLEIAMSNLQDILFSFSSTLATRYSSLTPREIQVASLIRDGKSSKEIAQLFNLSVRSVEYYRENVRKKMGLANKKINLRSYLFSLK
ncbi:MAG: PAS domain S-box protein [Deltaproteobacteria bacterium]|nr:PAS domain S-box protein [Deltaproteobacteria bacterium]MBW2085364.1 PAS domain S-box protein [Deltaproteobacteria bacterium]